MQQSPLTEPIVFTPLYMERVWGGRSLESVYNRALPQADVPFGESWEVVDRGETEQSRVCHGSFPGQSLHELWMNKREAVFGGAHRNDSSENFPVLVKILDARDRLSIQVHPPALVAARLNGEPKTEMWYIAHADPGAKLYVGLNEGVDRQSFEQGIADGLTEQQVHAIEPKAGEFIFIPSGRLHAIGAGLLIYEIQQNSDTTYRVFDWNRLGLDGKPRDLHVEASLQCIDFTDIEPSMDVANGETLVKCDYFQVAEWILPPNEAREAATEKQGAIITVVEGEVSSGTHSFKPGDFFLVPAKGNDDVRHLRATNGGKVLVTTLA